MYLQKTSCLMRITKGYEIIKSNWALKKIISEERFYLESCLFSVAKENSIIPIMQLTAITQMEHRSLPDCRARSPLKHHQRVVKNH